MNPKGSGTGDRRGVTSDRNESENEDMDESGLSDDEDAEGALAMCDGEASSDDDEEEEDSSDMDVAECERQRLEFIDNLTDLENQFAILREQLYRERQTQIEAKLAEVKSGRAPEYLQPLEELRIQMETRHEVATIQRKYSLANIQSKFEAENFAADQNFQSEKEMLFDAIKADLEDKIRKLEEDKSYVDYSTCIWEQSTVSKKSLKIKKGGSCHFSNADCERRKKPVTVSAPYIIYMLSDDFTEEDSAVCRKAAQQADLLLQRLK